MGTEFNTDNLFYKIFHEQRDDKPATAAPSAKAAAWLLTIDAPLDPARPVKLPVHDKDLLSFPLDTSNITQQGIAAFEQFNATIFAQRRELDQDFAKFKATFSEQTALEGLQARNTELTGLATYAAEAAKIAYKDNQHEYKPEADLRNASVCQTHIGHQIRLIEDCLKGWGEQRQQLAALDGTLPRVTLILPTASSKFAAAADPTPKVTLIRPKPAGAARPPKM